MGRPPKESTPLNVKLNKALFVELDRMSKDTSLSKTAIVERALAHYIKSYNETGRI